MKKTFAIRVEEKTKIALEFSSHLTRTPTSKLLTPFIEEGANVILGGLLLLMVDREAQIGKQELLSLIDSVIHHSDDIVTSPSLIKKIGDIMKEDWVKKRFEQIYPNVTFSPGTLLSTGSSLKTLLEELGRRYRIKGGSLKRIQMSLAIEILMDLLIRKYYFSSATGSIMRIKEGWILGEKEVKKLGEKVFDLYISRTELSPVEAIEVGEYKVSKGKK